MSVVHPAGPSSRGAGLDMRWRRTLAITATVVLALIAAAAAASIDQSLGRDSTMTGWALVVCLVVLTALGVRRRLPGLRLGSMSTWTQVHLYVGAFSIWIYTLHSPSILAGGMLEGPLSWAFVAVSISGLYGLYASRSYPRRIRLAVAPETIDSDHVTEADAILSIDETADRSPAGAVLRQHYAGQVRPFLDRHAGWWFTLWPNRRRSQRVIAGIRSTRRYLDAEHVVIADRMIHQVRRCDADRYAAALRRRLRTWVAVHAATTVVLIGGSVVHVVVVWMYRS